MTERVDPLPKAALFGSLFGFCAWAIVLGILIAASGDGAAFWRVTPVTVFASLGLWTLVISSYDAARMRFGSRSREAGAALFGGVLIAVGALLELVEGIVLPELVRHPDIVRTLEATGSTLQIATWLPATLLGLGVALASIPVWRTTRPQ